jgi:acetoin utilization deacetylase AcuC-like enzyme
MRSDHDVDVPDGTGDLEYIALMEEWLPKLFDTYSPRLVYFQAGVDALAVDSFGKLKMTRAGMLRRNHMVYDECIKRDVPLVITMGGGYSKPFDASVDAHADVFRAAAYRFASPPTEPKGKKAVEVEEVEEVEVDEVEEVEEVAEEVIEKVVVKAPR